ncbi:MAG: hypothetical protein BWY98_00806 [Tenericutes bacterium ADurb.BinA155]|jgi:hypothetical protein|nr:MAG: hypothetical protein BWY98_00806 [Tenericutes bacterium ADurb.BinA155]
MDKFVSLFSYLQHQTEERIVLSFEDIEHLIGDKLCPSAYKYRAYWAPSAPYSLPSRIEETGYFIEQVSLRDHRLVLNRDKSIKHSVMPVHAQAISVPPSFKKAVMPQFSSFEEEILLDVPPALSSLETDAYLMVKLTQANSDLVEKVLAVDPDYTPKGYHAFKSCSEEGELTEDAYSKIIKNIVIENSTRSKDEVVKALAKYCVDENRHFLARLQEGKPRLVDDIVSYLTNQGFREEKSLSSKVCRYLNEWIFHQDDYTINDSVVRSVMPYYLAFYQIPTSLKTLKAFESLSYVDFLPIFDLIREKSEGLTRHQLDHLLWYSYKNDRIRTEIAKALAIASGQFTRS